MCTDEADNATIPAEPELAARKEDAQPESHRLDQREWPSRRTLLRGVVVAVVFLLAVVWGRAVVSSHKHYHAGEHAAAQEDAVGAVLAYRRAVQWHAPAFTRSADALDRLEALGADASAAGDLHGALFAYRSARWAILSTRHIGVPHRERLSHLHIQIAALMADQRALPRDGPHAQTYASQLDDFAARRPQPLLALGASLAFMGWLLSMGMLALRGLARDGRVVRREALRWSCVTLALFMIWMLLVRLA